MKHWYLPKKQNNNNLITTVNNNPLKKKESQKKTNFVKSKHLDNLLAKIARPPLLPLHKA